MRYKYIPMRPAGINEPRFGYTFAGDIITATYTAQNSEPVTDTFDFSQMPNGEANIDAIETILPENPIRSAKRINGVLHVELLYYHGPNATYEERFPKWQEVL